MPSKTDDTLAKAWEYHNAADTIIHQRLSSFFASQAIMLVPFTIIAIKGSTNFENTSLSSILVLFQIVLALIALRFCFYFDKQMVSIAEKLEFLKENYLLDDPVYSAYLFNTLDPQRVKKLREERQRQKTHLTLPKGATLTFKLMWFICLILAIGHVIWPYSKTFLASVYKSLC